MVGRGTSSQRSGVVLLSRDVVLASWLRYLCAPSVRVVTAPSGYEAAAEILAWPAEALVIDFRAMSAAHHRLLDTARALGMQILGVGKVPGDLPPDALSRVRLVSQADLPDALREILSAETAAAAPAADAPRAGGGGQAAAAKSAPAVVGTSAAVAAAPAGRAADRPGGQQAARPDAEEDGEEGNEEGEEGEEGEEEEDTRQDAASTIRPEDGAEESDRGRPHQVKLAPKHAPRGQTAQGPASAGPAGETAGASTGAADGTLSAASAGDAAPTAAPTDGSARPDARPDADGKPARQPSDLLTPEEVAALLESDL